MSRIYDVAVIGAGVIGAAVSYFTALDGADVILLDKGDIAEGTSSKSDGNILVCDKMPGFDSRLAKMSQDMYPQLEKELVIPLNGAGEAACIYAKTEEELEIARDYCSQMAAQGIPMRMMDQKDIQEDEPYLAKDLPGGIETACDSSLYPIGLSYGYALTARKLGAKLSLHNPVTAIAKEQDFFIIQTEQGEIHARNVVNCAGVWSPSIGAMLGLSIPVSARQGQILVSEQTFPVARRKVAEFGYMLAKFGTGNYKRPVSERVVRNGVAFVFEPTAADNFLIGSSRRFAGEDIRTDIEVMQALADLGIRSSP